MARNFSQVPQKKPAGSRSIMGGRPRVSRQKFIGGMVAFGGAATAPQSGGSVRGFDHVALPMQNTEAMLAFYRALGLQVAENPQAVAVYIGTQMINFHRPTTWQRETFTLRESAAKTP